MSIIEAVAVEHFAHELAAPGQGAATADLRARSDRMTAVTNEVIARFAPRPGMSDAHKARNLKAVDGLISLMSSRLDEIRAGLDEMTDRASALFDAAVEAHDHTVGEYYRLMALRSDLDPETWNAGEPLTTSAEVAAWADRIYAQANAKA